MEQNDVLQVQGINSRGYGIIAKLVMQDKRLTIEAKGIYAYFRSYAGAGQIAFPGRDKIVSDLRIGVKRYYNHFNLLKEYGYIIVKQVKDQKNKFTHNVYILPDTVPCTQNDDTAKPYTRFEHTTHGSTGNDHTNNNSFEINSLNINRERAEGRASAPAPTQSTYGEYGRVKLTADDYTKLIKRHGEEKTLDYIGQLDSWLESTGKCLAGHCATIERWIKRGDKQAPSQCQPRKKFVNFEQRDWDYNKLEQLEREHLAKELGKRPGSPVLSQSLPETGLNKQPIAKLPLRYPTVI